MSDFQQYSMSPKKFLTVAVNVIYKCLIDVERADAKRIFNEVNQGKTVNLLTVRMEDESDVLFELMFDPHGWKGEKFNFSAFRKSVASLVVALGESLEQSEQVPVFIDEGKDKMLVGVPGVTREGENVNVMMMGTNQSRPGRVLLKLIYMDPPETQQVVPQPAAS